MRKTVFTILILCMTRLANAGSPFTVEEVKKYNNTIKEIYSDIATLKADYPELKDLSDKNLFERGLFAIPVRETSLDGLKLLGIEWGGYPYKGGDGKEGNAGIHIFYSKAPFSGSNEEYIPQLDIPMSSDSLYLRCKIFTRNSQLDKEIIRIIKAHTKNPFKKWGKGFK